MGCPKCALEFEQEHDAIVFERPPRDAAQKEEEEEIDEVMPGDERNVMGGEEGEEELGAGGNVLGAVAFVFVAARPGPKRPGPSARRTHLGLRFSLLDTSLARGRFPNFSPQRRK